MSETLRRISTPPAAGTFNPYTAGMTGAFPSFFAYEQAPAVNIDPERNIDESLSAGEAPYTGGLTGLQPALPRSPLLEGDSVGLPSQSVASPNQSFGGVMESMRNAAVAMSPMGLLSGLAGLAISDFRGREPTFNLNQALFGREVAQEENLVTPETIGEDTSLSKDPGGEDKGSPADPGSKDATAGTGNEGPGPGAEGGGFGATDSSQDGGYGGESQFKEGGLVPLAGGGKIAVGPGGGLDDLIPTSINGRRAAALSDGEFVIPADVVSMMGDGSTNAGSRRLYDLVRQVRDTKTGTTRQAGPLPVGEILKRSLSR